MARNMGKLGKLKCMIKRWHSSNRITHTSPILKPSDGGNDDTWQSASFHGDEVPSGHHPVYVGKSRRRYLVSSRLVEHPVFRNLLEVSGSGTVEPLVVGCEVVLFEHLLWMLENADPKTESIEEIVEFYAC